MLVGALPSLLALLVAMVATRTAEGIAHAVISYYLLIRLAGVEFARSIS